VRLAQLRHYIDHNVIDGVTTVPRHSEWRTAALALPYATAALVLGLGSGLLTPGWPALWELAVIPPLLVLYPSLIEEVIFRGLLVPRSLAHASMRRKALAVSASTVLFVIMHPLNHWLIGLSDTSDFTDPIFLAIVTLLGVTCAIQRLRSASLWFPIATHWATVVAWNLFLGRDLTI